MQKREGFTLIELIFSMVIIALVFTVIPKIIYAFNKSDLFSIREDALFNGISMTDMISSFPWDENDTEYNDILITDSTNINFDCNTTSHYRAGGFIGSRNCEHNLSASFISSDGESDPLYFNDLDDFNDVNITTKLGNDILYTLSPKIYYALDDNSVFEYDYADHTANIKLYKASESNKTTNLKKLKVDIYYSGKRGKVRQISGFSYISSNIGQVLIKKRSW